MDKGWYQVAWAFLKVSLMVPGIARQTVGDLSGLRCLGPASTIKISREKFLSLTIPPYLIWILKANLTEYNQTFMRGHRS